MPLQGTSEKLTKKMTKLIIFDLDGTLIDTRKDIADACNYALCRCGYPPRNLDEYNLLVGRGIYNLFRSALPQGKADEETVAQMAEYFIPYYNEHKCDFTKPYEGIIQTLEILSQRGMRFAVASNKYQEGTEQLVEKFFGNYEFVRILGQRDGMPIKPDPQIVAEAMEALPGITEDEVVYCGDSDVDMQTGMNAGVKTIGVTWGFRTREELAAYSPWALIDRPQEIIDIIYGN